MDAILFLTREFQDSISLILFFHLSWEKKLLKTKLENIHAEAAEAIIEEQQKRAKIESIIKDVLSDTLRFVSLDGEGSNEVISELIHGSNFLWMAKDLPNNLWLEIKKQAEDVTEHRYGLPSIPKGILPDSLESETEWRK